MKHFRVQPVTLYCMVEFENYLAQMIIMTRQSLSCKNHVVKSDANKSDVNMYKSFWPSWSLCCLPYIIMLYESAFMDL